MGEKKSTIDEPTPSWLTGVGSETLDQRAAFQDWLESSPDYWRQEMIRQLWLPLIRGEYKRLH